jgi:nitroimidazol reductase NimA-like FMN-containing flavoprotein (pyridoxamine 5'-phosphate oxidase superfamily)
MLYDIKMARFLDHCHDKLGATEMARRSQMSSAPRLRRADKLMAEEQALATLERGFAGHLATVGENGHPYCLPLLYVWADGRIYLHNSRAKGHLRSNVDHESRVCFAVDEAGEAFAYGRFECDSAVAYRSVIVFGTIAVVDDIATKQRFCERLMVKYAKPEWDRPKGFFPRLAEITVYAITPQRMSGKETPLPAVAEQWPALDRTKSPNARVT